MTETSIEQLRRDGRSIPAEFSVGLSTGETLSVRKIFRWLPGKRITGEAEFAGETVLAKLFISASSGRHCRREVRGINLLKGAGIPTPEIKFCAGGILITEFLTPSETLLERITAAGDDDKIRLLTSAARLIGRMHAAGVVHGDLHSGNFLCHNDGLLMIDGDAVRTTLFGKPARGKRVLENLSMLLLALPAVWSGAHEEMIAYYRRENPAMRASVERIRDVTDRLRRDVFAHLVRKSLRSSTAFSVRKSFFRFTSVIRNQAELFRGVLSSPDRVIETGMRLKTGESSTVAAFELAGRRFVMKRYNLKSRRHAFLRFWRKSRAWNSWKAGQLLALEKINTPVPAALIEERVGPFRRRAWIINDYCDGTLLETLNPQEEPSTEMKRAIVRLFSMLHAERISHGDMKASNLMWSGGRLYVIDLDVMKQHRFAFTYKKKWDKDRARFLRNWKAGTPLRRWLENNLPD